MYFSDLTQDETEFLIVQANALVKEKVRFELNGCVQEFATCVGSAREAFENGALVCQVAATNYGLLVGAACMGTVYLGRAIAESDCSSAYDDCAG